MSNLINKYNVAGPRYTSYPTVPYWKEESFNVNKWQQSVVNTMMENNGELSIYIHLPFCESLCTFCGCHKYITKRKKEVENYMDHVLNEWQLYLEMFPIKPIVKEIHLGGGTPTFFAASILESLMLSIFRGVKILPHTEMSFEGHPNNTSREHLQTLYNLGFRRVSFGVQDYNQKVQKAINRLQSFENVAKVHQIAKEIGYTSISHDLVYGLPFQNIDAIKKTIQLTLQLAPSRISLYSYAHVPWVKGVGQRGFMDKDIPSGEYKRSMYDVAKQYLVNSGYVEVGMDHFALPTDDLCIAQEKGKLHRNFMGYTTSNAKLLIGLGMSAISESQDMYAQNEKSLKLYQDLIERQSLAVNKGHHLSTIEQVIKKHILDLICRYKTHLAHNKDYANYYQKVLRKLEPFVTDGLVKIQDDTVNVTTQGKVFIRNICMSFDPHFFNKNRADKVFSSTI